MGLRRASTRRSSIGRRFDQASITDEFAALSSGGFLVTFMGGGNGAHPGRVVEYGRTSDVIARPRHPYTRALLACAPSIACKRDRLATDQDPPPPAEDRPQDPQTEP